MNETRPIRLLIVLTAPVRGGIEEVVLSLLAGLDPTEFSLGLAAPASLLEQMRAELDARPVQTFPVAAESWLDWRSVSELARCIRAFKPDIVNPHLFRSTLVAAPLAKWLGVRCVVETYHGREAWRRGGFFRAGFFIDHLVSRFVDRVIAVSAAARDFLVTVKRIPARKITVIPNGRDLSRFQPGCTGLEVRRELGIPADAPVLGIVGRLEEQKGHRYGIEAFAKVSKDFPTARLLIVGNGSLRAVLEQQARDLGISDRVIFTGFRPDVPRLYDAMDVVMLPSLYEGMPLTVIEAAAMGKPVVATAVDGTVEIMEQNRTGILTTPGDVPSLATALLLLLRSPEKARALGAAARIAARERTDLPKQMTATADAYLRVVQGLESPARRPASDRSAADSAPQ